MNRIAKTLTAATFAAVLAIAGVSATASPADASDRVWNGNGKQATTTDLGSGRRSVSGMDLGSGR